MGANYKDCCVVSRLVWWARLWTTASTQPCCRALSPPIFYFLTEIEQTQLWTDRCRILIQNLIAVDCSDIVWTYFERQKPLHDIELEKLRQRLTALLTALQCVAQEPALPYTKIPVGIFQARIRVESGSER